MGSDNMWWSGCGGRGKAKIKCKVYLEKKITKFYRIQNNRMYDDIVHNGGVLLLTNMDVHEKCF